MSESKKYFYMRLKENFFDTNEMKILESMQDGYKYSNILLKLYLLSLRDDGKLMFNDRIPYNSQMIATITRHSIGDVEKAIQLFKDLGLIEILDSGAIYMLDIQKYIGKSSTEADRIKQYRKSVEQNKQIETQKCVQMYDKRTPEIEIELEKDIKIDKETDIDSELERHTDGHYEDNVQYDSNVTVTNRNNVTKRKTFVKPSNQDVLDYCNSIGHGEFDIEKFIDYYESNGWKVGKNPMKDWKAAVRNWIRKAETEQKNNAQKKNDEERGFWF